MKMMYYTLNVSLPNGGSILFRRKDVMICKTERKGGSSGQLASPVHGILEASICEKFFSPQTRKSQLVNGRYLIIGSIPARRQIFHSHRVYSAH